MATRTELLDTFEANLVGFLLPASGRNPAWTVKADNRSAVMETEQSIDGTHMLETHICYYWDDDQDVKTNAQFYVKDPGEAGEEAVWIRAQNPKPPDTGPTFQQELIMWLNSQIDQLFGTSTLRHIESMSANNMIERGTAVVIMETDTGDFVRRSIAVWKDASEVWQFKTIT